jgi:hypothetical protein
MTESNQIIYFYIGHGEFAGPLRGRRRDGADAGAGPNEFVGVGAPPEGARLHQRLSEAAGAELLRLVTALREKRVEGLHLRPPRSRQEPEEEQQAAQG